MSDEVDIKTQIQEGIEAGIKAALAALPAVESSTKSTIVVTKDEGDREFKSLAEFCRAVKMEAMNPRYSHPRLQALKSIEIEALKAVQGASEGVPADGGYLLEPTLTPGVISPMHEEGPFVPGAAKLPVSGNSNYGWLNGVDETSRATGSRWGGLRGYRLSEGDTKTGSKPKFRRIEWQLKKYAVLAYGTDELLMDTTLFASVVRQGSREELSFMANDDILNGTGVGGPLGILNAPALVSFARTDANTVQHADILAMWQRLHPRHRKNAKWYINSEVEPQLDALYFTGTTSVLSPYIGYTPEGVMRIKGKDVVVTEFNAALGTLGDILLADMSDYLFFQKTNIEEATSIHIEFLTDQTVFRFVTRCDGQPARASAITPYKGTNTQSAFVALTAAS